jgi:adhesin/invasin
MRNPSIGMAAFLSVVFVSAGCGGSNSKDDGHDSQPRGASALQIVSGDTQTGTVGKELPNPVVVRVVDASGAPVSGQLVNFRVATGGGSVFAGASLSNADGVVQERWTLGSVAGPQRLEARAVDSTTGAAIVLAAFEATALPGPASLVKIVSGNDQLGGQFQSLTDAIQALVADSFGNPVSGVQVSFTPDANCGTASPATATSDAAGLATTTWTLGLQTGAETLRVHSPGLADATVTASASPIPVQAKLTVISGDTQAGVVGELLPDPLVVKLTDLSGSPIAGQDVVFDTATLGDPSDTAVTGSDGTARSYWRLGPSPIVQYLQIRSTDPLTQRDVTPIWVSATAAAGPVASITIASGDQQTGEAWCALAQKIQAHITDRFANPLQDVPVVFAATSLSGHPFPTTATTDSLGDASTTWVLGGTVGTQTLTVTVTGISPVSATATGWAGPVFDGTYYAGSDYSKSVLRVLNSYANCGYFTGGGVASDGTFRCENFDYKNVTGYHFVGRISVDGAGTATVTGTWRTDGGQSGTFSGTRR